MDSTGDSGISMVDQSSTGIVDASSGQGWFGSALSSIAASAGDIVTTLTNNLTSNTDGEASGPSAQQGSVVRAPTQSVAAMGANYFPASGKVFGMSGMMLAVLAVGAYLLLGKKR